MRKSIIISVLLITALISLVGCTVDEPGYVIVSDVTGNPSVQVVDSDGDIISIDSATLSLTIIEYEHHEIHGGNSFQCWYEQTVSDIGDQTIIAFRTPATSRWLHLVPLGSASTAAHARILEAPLITDNTGASLPVYNRDRNSSTNSIVIDTSQNPDVAGQAMYFTEITMGNVTGGTEIAHAHVVVGEKKPLGGTARGTQEWILRANTFYAFIIESDTNDDNIHTIELNWYEHINAN